MVKCNISLITTEKSFKNIHGKSIILKLIESPNLVNISIGCGSVTSIYYYSVVLLTATLINLVCLYCNSYSLYFSTAIFVICLVLFFRLLRIVIEENIIAVKPLGYQITTKYILGKKFSYVPYKEVEEIFINEVIYQLKVIYVLTLLAKDIKTDEEKVIPLFTASLPRVQCLELIYRRIEDFNR